MLNTVFKVIISFPLLFLIPGYITLCAFRLKGRDLERVLFLSVFSSVLLSSWFGLVLAEVARFSRLHLLLSFSQTVSQATDFKVLRLTANV